MRQLTAYASYHDNLGELLIGRARFCNLDGSPAQVFGIDNATQQVISLGSVVFTNSSGQLTPQVLLENHDYLIFFDKYIGDGTMAEEDLVRGYLYNGKFYLDAAHTTEIQADANKIYVDVPTDTTYRWAGAQYIAVGSDRDSWEEQGSARDYYNTLGVELLSPATRTIDTVADLHTSVPLGEDEIVLVYGYNSPGDKPPIFYQWDPVSIAQDDGGAVIKVDSVATGRWVFQEPPEKLDVRHFGAFPSSGSIENPEQRYAIQRAGIYAYTHGCGLYFYADQFAAFYDISGLTIHDVDCKSSARLYSVDPNIKSYIVGIEQIFLGGSGTGRIELIAPTVRTSWENGYHYADLNPSEKLIVDAPLYGVPRQWSGIIVEMGVYCGPNMTFDNCEIVSRGVISGNITLKNIDIKTEWFTDEYSWTNLSMINCTVRLRNCKDANTYVILKNKQNDANYGDLGEQTVTGATLLAGCVAENAYFVNVTIQGSTELHNVTGTVIADPENPLELTAVDCWLTFSNSSDFGMYGLSFYRGAITASVNILVTDQLARADSPLVVSLKDVELNSRIRVDYAQLNLERCVVKQPVIHSGLTRIRENIVGNKFENASLTITELGDGNGRVFASWKNNECSTVIAPIIIDRSKISQTESDHSYIYEGNSGTFPQTWVNKIVTLTVTEDVDIAASFDNTVLRASSPAPNRLRFFCRGSGRGLDPVNLFRVGTDPFSVHVRWAPVPMPSFNDLSLSVVPNEFLMKAEYVPGSYFSFKPNVFPPENGALNSVAIIGEYVGTAVQLSGAFLANMIVSVT